MQNFCTSKVWKIVRKGGVHNSRSRDSKQFLAVAKGQCKSGQMRQGQGVVGPMPSLIAAGTDANNTRGRKHGSMLQARTLHMSVMLYKEKVCPCPGSPGFACPLFSYLASSSFSQPFSSEELRLCGYLHVVPPCLFHTCCKLMQLKNEAQNVGSTWWSFGQGRNNILGHPKPILIQFACLFANG